MYFSFHSFKFEKLAIISHNKANTANTPSIV